MDILLNILIIAVIAVICLAAFSGMGSGLAFASRWSDLADRYQTKQKPPDGLAGFQFGMVGLVPYNGLLKVGVAEGGLYVASSVFLWPSHPPLFIPWCEIRSVKKVDNLLYRAYLLTVGSPQVGTLLLPRGSLASAKEMLDVKLE
ncbi:hypothetical protein [Gloeobacter morelensis]|uniref:Uncharacterized protein n=1 Tax=Gloeobacter morelensis MG652769 TaxID=2781736 RepID=A0ABY3PMW7_9CYAN|nr:hypothetical protein [Gloeobacter morelensis]UFP95007.1 hypothetical protein ISF26_01800 [Gloeobacter morelensis MG652769]